MSAKVPKAGVSSGNPQVARRMQVAGAQGSDPRGAVTTRHAGSSRSVPLDRKQGVPSARGVVGQPQVHHADTHRSQAKGSRLSVKAAAYSRYASATRYAARAEGAGAATSVDGGFQGSSREGEGVIEDRSFTWLIMPYVTYGVVALVLVVVWFVWVKATVAGSVMAHPMPFSIGVILLFAMLVLGALLAIVAGLLSRDRNQVGTFDALALSMGKTSIGMGAFVVVWIVLMVLAA